MRLLYVSATYKVCVPVPMLSKTASECGSSSCMVPVPNPPNPSSRFVSAGAALRCTTALSPLSATHTVPSPATVTPCGPFNVVVDVDQEDGLHAPPLMVNSSIRLLSVSAT